MTSKDQWVWMPHAAHFVGAINCSFRLATCVGDFIVSTVGELFWGESVNRLTAEHRDPEWLIGSSHLKGDAFQLAYFARFGYEEIGIDRTYETMVFPAEPGPAGGCCPWQAASWANEDFASYTSAAAARLGHMAMCETWSTRTRGESEDNSGR